MSEPPEELRAQAAEWQQRAQATVDMLIKAARENNGQAGWSLASQIYHADNEFFLAMIIGNLTMRVVNTERRADQAHGPLVTPAEQGVTLPPMPIWATSMADQIAAAVQNSDYKAFAEIAVDANLRAYTVDEKDGNTVDLDHTLRSMLVLDHQSAVLIAAEALRRLYEKGGT